MTHGIYTALDKTDKQTEVKTQPSSFDKGKGVYVQRLSNMN